MGGGKKDVVKKVLMTRAEAERLEQKASEAGMSVGAFIRQRVSERPNDYPEIRKLLADNINELNHIGVNVNQIARNSNSGLYVPEDKERLFAYMKKLCKRMDEVVRLIGNM